MRDEEKEKGRQKNRSQHDKGGITELKLAKVIA